MNNPIWLLQSNEFLEDTVNNLKLALNNNNIDYLEVIYNRLDKLSFTKTIEDNYHILKGRPIIEYGSIDFITSLRAKYPEFSPGSYGMTNTNCTDYYHQIPKDLLLNGDCIYVTWAEFSRNHLFYFNLFKTDKLFIRSNSGMKVLTGQVITLEDISYSIPTINHTSKVSDKTLILLSSVKPIPEYEYRFVIADRKVVTGCGYGWNRQDISQYPKKAHHIANILSNQEFQLDTVYTCDIHIDSNGDGKVVELNSFSSAGLYACDCDKIVKEVSGCAVADYIEFM